MDQINNQPFKTALPYIDNSDTSVTTYHNYIESSENLKDQSTASNQGFKKTQK